MKADDRRAAAMPRGGARSYLLRGMMASLPLRAATDVAAAVSSRLTCLGLRASRLPFLLAIFHILRFVAIRRGAVDRARVRGAEMNTGCKDNSPWSGAALAGMRDQG